MSTTTASPEGSLLDRAAASASPKRFTGEPPSAFAPLDETYRDKYDAFERADDLREAAAERDERAGR